MSLHDFVVLQMISTLQIATSNYTSKFKHGEADKQQDISCQKLYVKRVKLKLPYFAAKLNSRPTVGFLPLNVNCISCAI